MRNSITEEKKTMAAVRDYGKLAADIKDMIGESNITSATHCATRLRLVLKQSPSAGVTEKISSMPGVIQVIEKGGQYQIVIGTHAKDVYSELMKILSIDESAAPEVKQSLMNRMIATMSAVFAPFVYVLAAAGLIQGVLIIITFFAPAFAETGTYGVLNFLSWTPFTFLPVFIGITASRHFKCNTYIAVWCCLALVNSYWGDIAARVAAGESIRFLIFPLSSTTYTSTVLPPLFLVLLLSYLERFLEKHVPDFIKALAVPFLCAAIMVPLTIVVIGPLTSGISNVIAAGYNALYALAPALAGLIVGSLWEVIVVFGVHWGIVPIVLANYENFGFDTIQIFITLAVISVMAACFAVALKSRNKEMKSVALPSGITAVFGITEPAIYGCVLRLKKPLICACIGGGAGSLVAAVMGAKYYVYAGLPGILTVVNAISEEGTGPFIATVVGAAATIVVSFVLVMVIGFEDPAEPGDEDTAAADPAAEAGANAGVKDTIIYAPMNGEMVDLAAVPDPTFSEGILGQGTAILPSEGKLYSPVDGTVASVFETKHAVSLLTDSGAELLIHVGLDTVSLGGKYFEAKVKDGDRVKKGDLLLEFDLDAISKDFKTFTPVLITNADDFEAMEMKHRPGRVSVGEVLYEARA